MIKTKWLLLLALGVLARGGSISINVNIDTSSVASLKQVRILSAIRSRSKLRFGHGDNLELLCPWRGKPAHASFPRSDRRRGERIS